MTKLIKKIKLTYDMEVLTGLHIGDSKETVEIGGVDIPVVRSPLRNNQPYVPGSSLKGKLRSLRELTLGAKKVGEGSELVNKLFGFTGNDNFEKQRTRLIVRDAFLKKESVEKLEKANLAMPYTEIKFENTINRVSGTAEHPRQIERVPAGVVFEVEFILSFFEGDDEEELKNELKNCIQLLGSDYLGGNGSRGYGQVKFTKTNEEPIMESLFGNK